MLVFALAWCRGKPLLIAVPLVLGAFIVEVYLRLWHTSLIWVVLIMVLWAVWDERESLTRPSLQNITAWVFALICLLQLPWTVAAVRFVRTHSTCPARATADPPDVIVFRETTVTPEQLSQLGQAGYVSKQSFCGTPFFPNQPLTPLCMDVVEKQ